MLVYTVEYIFSLKKKNLSSILILMMLNNLLLLYYWSVFIFDVAFTKPSFCNYIIKFVLNGVANYIVKNYFVIGISIKC